MYKRKDSMPSDYPYPILERVFQKYFSQPHKVDDIVLVCCQHLLEPQSKMFRKFIEFGFKPENIYILGKIYSTNMEILSELKNLGINVFQPEFKWNNFDSEHRGNCEYLSSLIPKISKCILLDDGGQLIETFVNEDINVLFAVEQTSSGFRKLENKQIPFPVINVARSETKLVQESPFIANYIYERVNLYCEKHNIKNPKILVVGLGPIGKSLQSIFRENNFGIEGFDIVHGHNDLIKNIQLIKPDIILGATGSSILTKEDIESLVTAQKIYLISASSSDREFPVSYYRTANEVHSDVAYKNITFVNNGFPLSFYGLRNEIEPQEIEKTICLLMGSVLDGVNIQNENGFVNVPIDLENLINS